MKFLKERKKFEFIALYYYIHVHYECIYSITTMRNIFDVNIDDHTTGIDASLGALRRDLKLLKNILL